MRVVGGECIEKPTWLKLKVTDYNKSTILTNEKLKQYGKLEIKKNNLAIPPVMLITTFI